MCLFWVHMITFSNVLVIPTTIITYQNVPRKAFFDKF